jgi:tRNA/rRNA methyltransferase
MTGRDGGADIAPLDPSPVVVLVRPQLADNIGAVARCMANGGLFHLRLVAPRDGWPQERAWRLAAGADRILDQATVHETVADAVADLQRVFATCPRPRHSVIRVLTARAAATELRAAEHGGLRTGILFGPERAGLDAEDLAQADTLVRYPLNPAFNSLNLAQAVMVMAYEWWTAADDTPQAMLLTHGSPVAEKGRLEHFLTHLVDQLDACGFLRNAPKRPGMVRNIRHLFQRGEVTEQELRTLHGMVAGLALGRRRLGRFEDDLLELAGETPGEHPSDQRGRRAADADHDQPERMPGGGQDHADPQHAAADEAAGDAGGDAKP